MTTPGTTADSPPSPDDLPDSGRTVRIEEPQRQGHSRTIVSWGITIVLLLFSFRIVDSRFGRALRALGAHETAAGALGVNVVRSRIQIFVLSAVYASLAGSLYAHFLNYVNGTFFDLSVMIQLMAILVVGGIGTLWGPVVGAALLIAAVWRLAIRTVRLRDVPSARLAWALAALICIAVARPLAAAPRLRPVVTEGVFEAATWARSPIDRFPRCSCPIARSGSAGCGCSRSGTGSMCAAPKTSTP